MFSWLSLQATTELLPETAPGVVLEEDRGAGQRADLGEQRLPVSARNRNAGQEGCWDTNPTVGKCRSDGICYG